jgi:ubiquinone/menaquinone biosynthesis C-methylase UbiE
MRKQNTIDTYSKHAKAFDAKIGKLNNYNQSYLDFIALATGKRTILDLACGPANISDFIKKHVPEISICGVDLSPEMLQIAEQKLPTHKFYNSDILDLKIPNQTFDMIICGFGLPYLQPTEIPQLLKEIQKFSHSKTVFYISCMQGNGTKTETTSFTGNDTLDIVYHTKESILDELKKHNFSLITYNELNYTEPDGSISIDMIFMFSLQSCFHK